MIALLTQLKQQSNNFAVLFAKYRYFGFSISYNIVTYENAQSIVDLEIQRENKRNVKAHENFIYNFNVNKIFPLSLAFPDTSDARIYFMFFFDLSNGIEKKSIKQFSFQTMDSEKEKEEYQVFNKQFQLDQREIKHIQKERIEAFSDMIELQKNL